MVLVLFCVLGVIETFTHKIAARTGTVILLKFLESIPVTFVRFNRPLGGPGLIELHVDTLILAQRRRIQFRIRNIVHKTNAFLLFRERAWNLFLLISPILKILIFVRAWFRPHFFVVENNVSWSVSNVF